MHHIPVTAFIGASTAHAVALEWQVTVVVRVPPVALLVFSAAVAPDDDLAEVRAAEIVPSAVHMVVYAPAPAPLAYISACVRMEPKLPCVPASAPFCLALPKETSTMDAKMPMMAMTTKSSMSVKPLLKLLYIDNFVIIKDYPIIPNSTRCGVATVDSELSLPRRTKWSGSRPKRRL